MNDYELIARVAAKDDRALHQLLMQHAPWLVPRPRSILPAADVEDVLQETFLARVDRRCPVPSGYRGRRRVDRGHRAQARRLGHRLPGVRGIYSHVTPRPATPLDQPAAAR